MTLIMLMMMIMMMTMLMMMMLMMMTMLMMMMIMTLSTSSYWKNAWKDKKISPGKRFLYMCVLRFSAWSGQGMNDRMLKDIRYKRLKTSTLFSWWELSAANPWMNWKQIPRPSLRKKYNLPGNISFPFPLVLAGTQLLTCPSLIPPNTLFPGQKLLLNHEIRFTLFTVNTFCFASS